MAGQGKDRRSIVGSTIIVKGYRKDRSDFAQTFKVLREISGTKATRHALVLKSNGGCTYRFVHKRLERTQPRRLCAVDCWLEREMPQ